MIVIISGGSCPDLQVNRFAFLQFFTRDHLVQGIIISAMVMRVRLRTVLIRISVDVDLPVHVFRTVRSGNCDPCVLTCDDSGRYVVEIKRDLLSVGLYGNRDHIRIDIILPLNRIAVFVQDLLIVFIQFPDWLTIIKQRIPHPGKHLVNACVAVVVSAGPGIVVEGPYIIVLPMDLTPPGSGRIHADLDVFLRQRFGFGDLKRKRVLFRVMDRQPDLSAVPSLIPLLAGSPDVQPILTRRHFRRGERDPISFFILLPV